MFEFAGAVVVVVLFLAAWVRHLRQEVRRLEASGKEWVEFAAAMEVRAINAEAKVARLGRTQDELDLGEVRFNPVTGELEGI